MESRRTSVQFLSPAASTPTIGIQRLLTSDLDPSTVGVVSQNPLFLGWFINIGHGPPDITLPHEFQRCCFLAIVISIVGSDPISLIRSSGEKQAPIQRAESHLKLDDPLKRLIDVIKYMICKRCIDMAERSTVGWCQIKTVWRMRNSNKRIFIKNCLDAFEE
jgi:hypothetical protein